MKNKVNYQCLNTFHSIFILLLYFVVYLFISPIIVSVITLLINPDAVYMNITVLSVVYLLIFLSIIILGKDLWCYAWKNFRQDYKNQIKRIIIMIGYILVLNMAISVCITFITGIQDSENQKIIKENTAIAPLFMLFTTCIFAPVVEELVFRGAIFTPLRYKYNYWIAATISSLLFGGIHLISSIEQFQWTDMAYIFLYGGMGYLLAYNYEKSGSILVSTGIHFGNNLFAFILLLLQQV